MRNYEHRKDNKCYVNGGLFTQDLFPGLFSKAEPDKEDCPWASSDGDLNNFKFDVNKYKALRQANEKITPGIILEVQSKVFFNSQLFNELARRYPIRFFKYKGNLDDVVKVCDDIGISVTSPTPSDLNAKNHFREIIPCISAEPYNIMKYTDEEKWNKEVNYCYSGDTPALNTFTEALNWAFIVVGIALMPFSGGATATIALSGAELAAVATSYVLTHCGTWPTHAANIAQCFK